MTRASAPTIHCDDESCDLWAIDEYALCVDSVGGVKITASRPAIGWRTVGGEDFCPEHAEADHEIRRQP